MGGSRTRLEERRPKLSRYLGLRLTEDEYTYCAQLAAESNVKVSVFIRNEIRVGMSRRGWRPMASKATSSK